ncbi:hypothetical protein PFLmoz3_02641 [Pseudomonas fluorescens]|uniref:Uncharacterized protein n=1 Tax=Pseudomonas fluorescens TaxID=294 RepID=A0A120G7R8_PSEFL|nr:hypothetical protein PFLmoz3_02641 [Pseudomonas fluorescens]
MHKAPCTNTSNSIVGTCWRISPISSRDSSRDRITLQMPCCCQNATLAQFTVLACTDRWIGICGKCWRTSMISPGSDMISASGPMAITGARSLRKVLSLALCGAMFTTT